MNKKLNIAVNIFAGMGLFYFVLYILWFMEGKP